MYLFRGKHPMYESLNQYPPDGVNYRPEKADRGPEEYVLYGASQAGLRRIVDGFFGIVGSPRFVPVVRQYDLVHSNRGFLPVGRNRFVIDVEHVSSFAGMNHQRLSRSSRLRALIEKGLKSDKCMRILPHSRAAHRTLALAIEDKKTRAKSTVVYPAIAPPTYEPRRGERGREPRILFIGEYYWKGGREFLEACTKLAERMDFDVKYISLRVHPPPQVLKRARERLRIDYVEGGIPRRELFTRVYPETDVFVMPTFIDTFGFAYLEAMAHHIPCIGTDHFAVPEIVENEVSGLTVAPVVSYFDHAGGGHPDIQIENIDNSPVVDGLVNALGRLIGSENLRLRMGNEGFRQTSTGRFSISARNSSLKDIYEESLHH